MIVPKIFILALFFIFIIHLYPAPPAYIQTKTTTERECALAKDAEIIWDGKI